MSIKRIIPIWENGQLNPKSENKVFCCAPFVHTYISPQSERRLCCASREDHSFQKQYIDKSNDASYGEVTASKTAVEDYNPVSLKEHWNSPYMRDIRVKLMAGEQIPQCDVCNNDILSISAYRKWFTGHLFQNKIQECFDSTDEEGYTTMEPISFDYRYSNLCNFKCRMCGEQLSSSWETEKKVHKLWTPENQPFMIPEVKIKMNDFQRNVVEPEFKDAISRGIVEEIYWVGGEPLMYDIHWWALEEMVNNGSSKHCYLRYNTNLSKIKRTPHAEKTLFDYLPHFKDWMICASQDGVGEIAEFIRTGLHWEEWLENFKAGQEISKGKMLLDLTITAPGMFSLKEYFDLSLQLDARIETKIMFAFHPDIMFTPTAWPRAILNKHIDKLLAYMEPLATHNQATLIATLKSMRDPAKRATHEEAFPDIYKREAKKGKAWQRQIQQIRPESSCTLEDIYSEDLDLLLWWDNI